MIDNKKYQEYLDRKKIEWSAREEQQQKSFDAIIEEVKKSKFTLITVAGGSLTIFISINSSQNSPFTIIGFAFLGISIIFGILSLMLSVHSSESILRLREKIDFQARKGDLKFIKSLDPKIDISEELYFIELMEGSKENYHKSTKYKAEIINELLSFTGMNGDKIENYHFLFFLLGIVFLVIGLYY